MIQIQTDGLALEQVRHPCWERVSSILPGLPQKGAPGQAVTAWGDGLAEAPTGKATYVPSVPEALSGCFHGVPRGGHRALPQRVRNSPSV